MEAKRCSASTRTRQTVGVPIHGDSHEDGDETVVVAIVKAELVKAGKKRIPLPISDDEATGTIADVAPVAVPEISVTDASAEEGEDETIDFVVSLDKASAETVRVVYITAPGTASRDSDFVWLYDTLQFAPGDTAETIAVTIVDDIGGPGYAAWGRMSVDGFDAKAPADGGTMRLDGEVTTGILGADAQWERWLAGVALSVSSAEGTFDQPDVDSATVESTLTSVNPYVRYRALPRPFRVDPKARPPRSAGIPSGPSGRRPIGTRPRAWKRLAARGGRTGVALSSYATPTRLGTGRRRRPAASTASSGSDRAAGPAGGPWSTAALVCGAFDND